MADKRSRAISDLRDTGGSMKVGNLVKRRDDHVHHGIVIELGPEETRTDHGNSVAKVQWNDGDLTCEFIKLLEVISESR